MHFDIDKHTVYLARHGTAASVQRHEKLKQIMCVKG